MTLIYILFVSLASAYFNREYLDNEYTKWMDEMEGKNITFVYDSSSITFKSYIYIDPKNYIKYPLPDEIPSMETLSLDIKHNTYDKAREYMYAYTDNIDGFIYGLYSNKSMYIGNDIVGIRDRAYNGRKGFSAEHVYPKSLLPTSKSKNDIHNLYPTDAYTNTRRSVYRYEDLTEGEKSNGLKFSGSYLNNKRWEPKQSSKGKIARAVAYMMFVYSPNVLIMDIETMKRWNIEDPVDQYDIDRNNRVYEVQNNFNPFVLYPSLINHIF